MDKVKLGLLGLVTVLGIYNIVLTNGVKEKLSVIEDEATRMRKEMKERVTVSKAQSPTKDVKTDVKSKVTPAKLPNTIDAKPKGPTTSIAFTEEIHEFGEVEVNSENLYAFEFTNTGTAPLTITNAKGSCGCTVPQWPKEPILPGQTGMIDVKYTPNKGQAGQLIEKVVTVTANTEPANTMVRIKANVKAN